MTFVAGLICGASLGYIVCAIMQMGEEEMRYPKPCRCGSNLLDYGLHDAAGIFCAYVCDKCESTVRAKFNPAIFDGHSNYATTSEEIDIGRYPGRDY